MTSTEDRLRHYLKKVTQELNESRRRLAEVENRTREPIAVVAMSCRYPGGVSTPEQLWELVTSDVDAIGTYPSDRGWEAMREVIPTKSSELEDGYAQSAGFLGDIAGFDAQFFGVSPREALLMDPQQRLALEVTWEGIERAGIVPSTLRGSRTGVFVGSTGGDYMASLVQAGDGYQNSSLAGGGAVGDDTHVHGDDTTAVPYIPDDSDATHMMTGSMSSVLSGRLAYAFGFAGPAITVDTACSSSLVAIHQACRSLRDEESDLAIAGGVMLMSTPMLLGMTRLAAAPDGRCKSFSDDADGTGWGEGIGMVVLERLSDARRNGHPIAAVIPGSAINQDGASNGMAAPNGAAQQQVIRDALAGAQLTGADIDVVEAHGTGTAIGDPIEAGALLATYGADRDPERPLWLGSIKSNIGHSGPAAGVAGVIKLVMAIQHRVLPRTLHVTAPTSKVDWSSGALRLLTDPVAWPSDRPLVGAVSSFGVSGTNGHVLLASPGFDETDAAATDLDDNDGSTADITGHVDPVGRAMPWVLSARTAKALAEQAGRLREWLSGNTVEPADIGCSLAARTVFKNRAVIVGSTPEELVGGLGAIAGRNVDPDVSTGVARNPGAPVFVYPGQGGQWLGMGGELLRESSVFAQTIADCERALAPWTDWSVSAVLRQDAGAPAMDTVDVIQPTLFAVMVALTELWQSVGVRPGAVIGHSQGEVAAAYVAGALSLADAAKIVGVRSRLLATLSGGTMISVLGLAASDIESRIARFGDLVSMAAVNSPEALTLSGNPEALAELTDELTAAGARVRRVPGATGAGHSADVDRFRDEILSTCASIAPRTARIPFFSTVMGDEIDTGTVDAEYWFRNMRRTVQFDAALRSALRAQWRTFVEPGPHPVLLPSVDRIAADGSVRVLTGGTLQRDRGDLAHFYRSAAELYVEGVPVDWSAAFTGTTARYRAEVPTYPFQRQRYWLPDEFAATKPGPAVTSDSEFWQLVERGDATALASLIGSKDADSLAEVLPDLSSWWKRSVRTGAADRLRYRVSLERLTRRPATGGRGSWYVLVPDGGVDDRSTRIVDAVRAHLGAVHVVGVPVAGDITDRLRNLPAADEAAGMLAVLGNDAATGPVDLARALVEVGFGHPLWWVTTGAVAVGPTDPAPDPDAARFWGPARVASLETSIWGGVVDVPESPDSSVLRELCAVIGRGVDDQVAVRVNGTFARRIRRARPAQAHNACRPSGTVLITGAADGVAGHLARRFAQEGVEHVVLTTAGDTAAARELELELGAAGTAVTFADCDLGDHTAVAGVLADITEDRPLTGVVHAAGAQGHGRDDGRQHLAGARHLDELTRDRDLDVFALLSPASGAWGVLGGIRDAQTSAALAALARRRRRRGLTATAVGWHDAAVGGVHRLDTDVAIEALWRAVLSDDVDAVVADIDWDRPDFAGTRAGAVFADLPEFRRLRTHHEQAAPDQGSLLAQLPGKSAAERERIIVDLIRGEIAAVLRYDSVDEIETTTPFRELGLDSISGLQIRKRLATATGMDLPIRMILEHPTPAELADRLLTELGGQDTETGTLPAERMEL